MKFEINKRNLNRKSIIIGIIVLTIIVLVLLFNKSYAKYSNIKTIHIVNSTVNYTVDKENPKINNVDIISTSNSITVTVKATDDKDIKEYYYQIDSNTVIKDASNTHTFNNLKAGTSYTIKIYVTDIKDKTSEIYTKNITTKDLTSSDVLAKLKLTSKGKYNTNDEFTDIATASDTGIYETVDDYGTSYYFRGLEGSLNNWVKFAGFYWRIIRINGNGSIRMIYQGVANGNPSSKNKTGTTTQIGTSAYNSSYNDNAYVGYMHGSIGLSSYTSTHANTSSSTIKRKVDDWYTTNINSKSSSSGKNYTTYLDTEVGFCNNREINNAAFSGYSGNGAGKSPTVYASAGIFLQGGSLKSSHTPSLKCANKDRDLFTVSSSKLGNKKLTYPVGLITIDEVIYAGGYAEYQKDYYLYNYQNYWTISPYGMDAGNTASVLCVDSGGSFRNAATSYAYGVRPVINLKASTSMTGTGSETDPYSVD